MKMHGYETYEFMDFESSTKLCMAQVCDRFFSLDLPLLIVNTMKQPATKQAMHGYAKSHDSLTWPDTLLLWNVQKSLPMKWRTTNAFSKNVFLKSVSVPGLAVKYVSKYLL